VINKIYIYIGAGMGIMFFSTVIIQVLTNVFSTKAVETMLSGLFMGFGSFFGTYLGTHIKEKVLERNNKKDDKNRVENIKENNTV
jgi:hypothetical protein